MDGISLSIIGLFVVLPGAAIWYKLGRLEQKLENHLKEYRQTAKG